MVPRLLLVVALTACRDKAEAPAPAPAPAPASAPASAPATPTPAGPAPVLPGSAIEPRALPADQAFAGEVPDPAWKAATEKTLRARLAKIPGAKIECKATICEVAIDRDAVKLEGELNGLRDIAQSVMLTQPTPGELRAYVRFDRPDL